MKLFLDVMYDDTKNARKIKSCDYNNEGKYPIIDQSSKNVIGYTDEIDGLYKDVPVIIFGDHTRRFKLVEEPFFIGADGTKVLKLCSSVYDYKFIYYYLLYKKIPNTGYNRHFKWIKELEFPEIPRSIQSDIVKKFEILNNLISSKNKLLELFDILLKSRFVEMFGDITERGQFKVKRWKDVLDIFNGKDYKTVQVDKGGYPVYGSGGIIARAREYICPAKTIIIGRKGSINNPILVNEKFWNVDTAFGIVPNETININYLFYFCKQYNFNHLNKATTLPSLTKRDLLEIEINIPSIEEQEMFSRFVGQINKLKVDVQKSIDETQLLMDSLMQEYFG